MGIDNRHLTPRIGGNIVRQLILIYNCKKIIFFDQRSVIPPKIPLDAIIPPQAAEWLGANVPNLETHFVGAGVHFIQEDQPDAIDLKLAAWLARN